MATAVSSRGWCMQYLSKMPKKYSDDVTALYMTLSPGASHGLDPTHQTLHLRRYPSLKPHISLLYFDVLLLILELRTF